MSLWLSAQGQKTARKRESASHEAGGDRYTPSGTRAGHSHQHEEQPSKRDYGRARADGLAESARIQHARRCAVHRPTHLPRRKTSELNA